MGDKIKSKKEKILGIIVGVAAFAISFYGIQQVFKTDLESELKNVALEINENTPLQLDELTRLDSASANGKTNFIYYYTLVDITRAEVMLDTLNKYLQLNVIEGIKTSPELKPFRDNNITLEYRYYDINGDVVTEISAGPETYNN